MFSLTAGSLPPASTDNVVFLVRPSLDNMDMVSQYIKTEESSGGSGIRTEFHVVFIPRLVVMGNGSILHMSPGYCQEVIVV